MSRAGFLIAGNWIVDLIHEVEHWPQESDLVRIGAQSRGIGGGAANVTGVLAKLDTGLPIWPMGAVGEDEYGAFVQQSCAGFGLSTAHLVVKLGQATAHTHVMSVPGQSRTFFYQGGANDLLGVEDFPKGTFSGTGAKLFYLGYLTLLGTLDRVEGGTTQAAQVLARARAAGLRTCVDLVSADRQDFAQIVAAAAPHIDYLIVNEVEAARATGLAGDPSAPGLARLAQALLAKGVGQAVVVHSAAHAHWEGSDGTRAALPVAPLPPAEIASHLGAGDAFCAGLMVALHRGDAPRAALDLANRVARASLRGLTAHAALPRLCDLDQD